jgi:two-component system response regulator ParR
MVTREATFAGEPVSLTTMEFDVLSLLVRQAGSVVSREVLYERVCGTAYDGLDRGMDVHVSRIRRKLQALGLEPQRLKAVRGAGYLLGYR